MNTLTKRLASQIQATLRNGFRSGRSKNIEYRKYQLLQLAYMIQDNAKRFEEAEAADLGRPALESQLYAPSYTNFFFFFFFCTGSPFFIVFQP
jgi:acyl-CoA reductase-like NAD-dependent aldehyde dehydrogenase